MSINLKDMNQLQIINMYKQSPAFFNEERMVIVKSVSFNAYNYIMNKKSEAEYKNIAMGDVSPMVQFNLDVARKYICKCANTLDKGVEFNLTMASIANIMKSKKCFYSGLPLNSETMTIDRVDNKKGYIKGNVVACHKEVNRFKAHIENPLVIIDAEMAIKILKKWAG